MKNIYKWNDAVLHFITFEMIEKQRNVFSDVSAEHGNSVIDPNSGK